MTKERKDWQFLVECQACKDVIYSRYDGEYRSCNCGAIAVDQTPYYARFIGERHNFKTINETDDNGSTRPTATDCE